MSLADVVVGLLVAFLADEAERPPRDAPVVELRAADAITDARFERHVVLVTPAPTARKLRGTGQILGVLDDGSCLVICAETCEVVRTTPETGAVLERWAVELDVGEGLCRTPRAGGVRASEKRIVVGGRALSGWCAAELLLLRGDGRLGTLPKPALDAFARDRRNAGMPVDTFAESVVVLGVRSVALVDRSIASRVERCRSLGDDLFAADACATPAGRVFVLAEGQPDPLGRSITWIRELDAELKLLRTWSAGSIPASELRAIRQLAPHHLAVLTERGLFVACTTSNTVRRAGIPSGDLGWGMSKRGARLWTWGPSGYDALAWDVPATDDGFECCRAR